MSTKIRILNPAPGGATHTSRSAADRYVRQRRAELTGGVLRFFDADRRHRAASRSARRKLVVGTQAREIKRLPVLDYVTLITDPTPPRHESQQRARQVDLIARRYRAPKGRRVMELAKVAYEAYREKSKGRSLATGAPIPPFEQLNENIREAWTCAAQAVAEKVRDDRPHGKAS